MRTMYIILTKEMACAYRDGLKTMVRKVAVPQLSSIHSSPMTSTNIDYLDDHGIRIKPQYGMTGDKTILGTTWAVHEAYDDMKPTELPRFDSTLHPINHSPIDIWSYFESDKKPDYFGKLRPAQLLPKKLRYRMPQETLTTVRVERLQDITEEDCDREGFAYERKQIERIVNGWQYGPSKMPDLDDKAREWFVSFWDKNNAKRGYSWDLNLWVWVLGWGK